MLVPPHHAQQLVSRLITPQSSQSSTLREGTMSRPQHLEAGRRSLAQVDQAGVLDTVQQLIGCLAASSPGLACPLAKKLIALTEAPSTPRYSGHTFCKVVT